MNMFSIIIAISIATSPVFASDHGRPDEKHLKNVTQLTFGGESETNVFIADWIP